MGIFYKPGILFLVFFDNCSSASLDFGLFNLFPYVFNINIVLVSGVALDNDCTASIGTGKESGNNDFTFSLKPFTNNTGLSMSCGLKCLSHTILFIVNCKPKIELHLFIQSYKISNNIFNEQTNQKLF